MKLNMMKVRKPRTINIIYSPVYEELMEELGKKMPNLNSWNEFKLNEEDCTIEILGSTIKVEFLGSASGTWFSIAKIENRTIYLECLQSFDMMLQGVRD